MVRKVINFLSPIAALAVVWVSLQSFVFGAEEAQPAALFPAPPTSVVARELPPELGSVSQILATTSAKTAGESVPDAVKRLIIAKGAVLLVPRESRGSL
jgi:hypothetical protein